MAELKTCPFCGGKAELKDSSEGKCDKYYYVTCLSCGAQTKKFLEWNGNEDRIAIDSWNNRIN